MSKLVIKNKPTSTVVQFNSLSYGELFETLVTHELCMKISLQPYAIPSSDPGSPNAVNIATGEARHIGSFGEVIKIKAELTYEYE